MAQSSFVRAALPAWLVACGWALAGAVPAPAHAQARFRAARAENFRQQAGPDQKILGSVYQGTELVAGDTKDGWVEGVLDGWILARGSVRAGGPRSASGWPQGGRTGGVRGQALEPVVSAGATATADAPSPSPPS